MLTLGATADWLRILADRRASENPWLILPKSPHNSDDAQRISYQELYRRALHAGVKLRQLGLRPADCVLLVADNSLESCLAVFGIWLAGGIVVPMSPPGFGSAEAS